jgi:hypothetical protein
MGSMDLYTSYSSDDLSRRYSAGMRITYQGVRMPNPYNAQLTVGESGTVQEIRNGQLIVRFDRGIVIPLSLDGDSFTA